MSLFKITEKPRWHVDGVRGYWSHVIQFRLFGLVVFEREIFE